MALQPVGSLEADIDTGKGNRLIGVALILSVVALHLFAFYITYKFYSWIPYEKYIDLEFFLDRNIPYIPWSSPVYLFGLIFPVIWGLAGLWNLPRKSQWGTICVYYALIAVGAILHIAIPTRAPWPFIDDLAIIQQKFKITFDIQPLACFPSMHVALAIFPAFIGYDIFRTRLSRMVPVVLSFIITISVVTAKEHWISDAVAGLILGFLAFWIWRKLVYNQPARKSPGNNSGSYQVEKSAAIN